MFKYRWRARFSDGTVIEQDPNDLYSKHNPDAEYNPSSFRDFQDYYENHHDELLTFELFDYLGVRYYVIMDEIPEIWDGDMLEPVEWAEEPLTEVRPIYYRQMECDMVNGQFGVPRVLSYTIGFQGKDKDGKNLQKTICVV